MVGLDVDADALETAHSNVEEFEDLSIGVHNKACIAQLGLWLSVCLECAILTYMFHDLVTV